MGHLSPTQQETLERLPTARRPLLDPTPPDTPAGRLLDVVRNVTARNPHRHETLDDAARNGRIPAPRPAAP